MSSEPARTATRYRLGFLGAWGLFAVALLLAGVSAIAEWENLKDARKLRRLERIDALISQRYGGKVNALREASDDAEERIEKLRSAAAGVEVKLDDSQDAGQTIIVSTAENKVFVRREGKTIFTAVCSTGKGTSMVIGGRTMVFDTPTGSFRIQSKEENPVWVPPDWHFVEEARKKKLEVVRLNPGQAIDAETGAPVSEEDSRGVWGLLRASDRPKGRVLKMKGASVVEVGPDGAERPLPPGELIRAGKTLVVPPPGSAQRRFEKVLGHYRLNIGNGYALHGTMATAQLGRSVSHGCVRLSDADIERLFQMAKVGDQVLIY
jgi:lipoprotein-anchoring transpeptidase ErfK/SrfK